jgi:phosphatidylglycerophosphatase A
VKPDQKFLLSHPAHFIAFGAGAGLMPKAPGTWGTLGALPIYAALLPLHADWVMAVAAALLFVVGIWAAGHAGRTLGVSDHSGIVIDEIAAFLLVLAFTPRTFAWCLAAFLLFRFFDIVKPWPIRLADRKIKGGFGVMFDDLLAALMAIGCILFARSLIGGGV